MGLRMKFLPGLFIFFGFLLSIPAQEPVQIPMEEAELGGAAGEEAAGEMPEVEAVPLPSPEPTALPVPTMTPIPEPVEAPDGFTVTVLGDRVNLRNEATLESDVVGQASYGDVYIARSLTDEWVEILPPDSVAVWVFSPLLFEDREVRAPVMNVRSGPGTQFSRLGQISRGTPVRVLESLGDWRRIAAPDGVTLWISRDFVQVPPAIAKPATPAPTPTPAPVPTPVTIVEVRTVERIVEVPVPATPTPEPQVAAPEGLDLVPLRGQGTSSNRRGIIRAYLLAAGNPSRFSLERPDGSTLCYLLGDEERLRSLAGRPVLVRGLDFWVTGEKLPVTKIISLKPVSGGNTP